MKESLNIETERVDDIPLLLAHMQQMSLPELLDKHIPAHGNRKGLSIGNMTIVWLSHILTEASHKMHHVQGWALQRKEVLRGYGLPTLEPQDMTDDRLADVLRALSDDTNWYRFEQDLMGSLVRVYEMQKACVRVDTTTVRSYGDVNEDGLLQFGYSKDHRPALPQLKLVLASLDPFGMPLATEVISGEKADDPVYLPIIKRVREGIKKEGILYVGDCKMSSLRTRATIHFLKNFYLSPLSAVQVSPQQIQQEVDILREKGEQLLQVERVNEKKKQICVAQGYETSQEITTEIDGQLLTWTERRLIVQSISGAEAAKQNLLERLKKSEQAIQELLVRKQGKPHLKTRSEIEKAIQEVLKIFRVEGLLDVTVLEEQKEVSVRAYKGKLSSSRQESIFTLKIKRVEEALNHTISHLSWRIYVTNQKMEELSFDRAIDAYYHEYHIEHNFGRLKGRSLSLAPMYVQRDDHRVGLVRLLTIALRVLTLLEGVVRQHLQKQERDLAGLYEGNPKRRTNQPTAEKLLKAFDNITLTIVHAPGFLQHHVTPLSSLQKEILTLLGLTPAIYSQLADDS